MDTRRIKKLIQLVKETGIGELEVKSGEESVRISCASSVAPVTAVAAPVPTAIVSDNSTAAAVEPSASSTPVAEVDDGYQQRSPMVGSVYLAATPGAKPYVAVGDRVEAGDVLCLIEAMKMFNKIEADVSGVISARMVENEQPVEYNQVLFIIEPDE